MAQMLVRAKIKLNHAEAYSFVSEAWMLSVDKFRISQRPSL